ncbi:NifU family protein [Curvivirga aplysinae]|uniref:NifU family protein n=1 Tax=Curvivirga aplysinae TaxID=2529852 RepID=UPI0012BB7223|nr:NifU family protein [Curvivirga aplysinae]MTI08608.1 NifU family protein [Curvivirga aplysinae]
MFIQTEQTPNPATLKFIPGRVVLEQGTADFTSLEAASGKSPLAERLFGVEGVVGVFFGHDFVTVTKEDEKEWYVMKPSILGVIMEHFTTEQPVMSGSAVVEDSDHAETPVGDGENDQVIAQIKELLDTRVRPAVAQDGGDIVFHGFEEGVVYLSMRGACAGCPSSTATLKMGIENMLRHYIPEVVEVRPAG